MASGRWSVLSGDGFWKEEKFERKFGIRNEELKEPLLVQKPKKTEVLVTYENC